MEILPAFRPARCIIEVSASCNLRCRTCTRWRRTIPPPAGPADQYLSTAEIKTIQAGLPRCGLRRVTYLGGEPFLNRDLFEIAEHARDLGIITAVVTNGTLLDEERTLSLLQRECFDTVIFSLDGPEAVHDRTRGVSGALVRAAGAARQLQSLKKKLRRRRPRVYMYTTLSALNCACLKETFALARKLDVNALRFISVSCVDAELMAETNHACGRTAITSHAYAVDPALRIPPQEFPRIGRELQEIALQARRAGIRLQTEALLREGRGLKQCSFLGRDLVIAADGEVLPCPMLPMLSLGSLRHASLSELLRTAPDRLPRPPLPICRECCVEKLDCKAQSLAATPKIKEIPPRI